MKHPESGLALSEIGRSLLAGGVSAATVLGVGVLGTLPAPAFVYAGLVGGLMFVGLMLVIPRKMTLQERLRASGGLSDAQAAEMGRFIAATGAHIRRLEKQARKVPSQREMIEDIALWARRIVANVQEDPTDLSRSTRFEVHLESAADVVRKLADIKGKDRGANSEVIADIVDKSEAVLTDIRDSFEQQYHSNLENNIRDVDVDLDVLKGALERQGLG
ncbi:5-bromo-4-chloroindolyl phosphate hydrolysis family protein [Marinobacter bohaiensis]|uniref:5-bromo-4-chloroindolyl phosphate hydrolysis family protein n=1 Tax=Marinobacter bohaiensis TaxID=2201898 RepID=UPI000DAEDE50|nr:5-bromo-4-chloroindolyl phosphate hydrolysis family protein [Marinobacter bohaiensis]